jgi:hypothetical protein
MKKAIIVAIFFAAIFWVGGTGSVSSPNIAFAATYLCSTDSPSPCSGVTVGTHCAYTEDGDWSPKNGLCMGIKRISDLTYRCRCQ